jgi:hypothetical protein
MTSAMSLPSEGQVLVETIAVSLYQRYGFEIMDEIHVGSSPSIFPMLRQAS